MSSPLITSITSENFEAEVLKSEVPVLLDFWAPWCGPCVAMNPTIDALAEMYEGQVKVAKANLDECKDLADRYSVRGIPALFLISKGEVLTSILDQSRTRISAQIDKFLE